MNDIELILLGNFKRLCKTSVGKSSILKRKERDTRNANNLPILVSVHVFISRCKDKNCMSLLFKLSFQGPYTSRNPGNLREIGVCK